MLFVWSEMLFMCRKKRPKYPKSDFERSEPKRIRHPNLIELHGFGWFLFLFFCGLCFVVVVAIEQQFFTFPKLFVVVVLLLNWKSFQSFFFAVIKSLLQSFWVFAHLLFAQYSAFIPLCWRIRHLSSSCPNCFLSIVIAVVLIFFLVDAQTSFTKKICSFSLLCFVWL